MKVAAVAAMGTDGRLEPFAAQAVDDFALGWVLSRTRSFDGKSFDFFKSSGSLWKFLAHLFKHVVTGSGESVEHPDNFLFLSRELKFLLADCLG